ncbi:MAG: tRNA (adenosine(37)-N6)-threonylcarbamoyltransferase complex dimerization subunit type 1 TsaB [Aquificae bacterium]|nr:tRNA (adenosine(37)-N6)-threonylcarbamoyltransferase complex dimerization subunit type 1 TsaB [Aquificota bacterium]
MVLSIDSFSDILGISLINNNKPLIRESFYKIKPYSELIIARLSQIFCEFSLKKEEITKIVVNKGPGSFTSLRVGITVAKTISYALNIPVYAYISLDVMAYRYRYFKGNITVLVNAGKGEIYIRRYISDGKNIKPISEITLEKLKLFQEKDTNGLIITKNVNIDKQHIEIVDDLSVDGCFYALKQNLQEDVMRLEPLYIRGL